MLKADAKNYVTATDFVKSHAYFFVRQPDIVEPPDLPYGNIEIIRNQLVSAIHALVEDANRLWDHDNLVEATEDAIKAIMGIPDTTIKKKQIWQVLRFLLTGGQRGPSLVETMEILGPEIVLERLNEMQGGLSFRS